MQSELELREFGLDRYGYIGEESPVTASDFGVRSVERLTG